MKLILSIMMINKADAFKVIAHSLRMNPFSKKTYVGSDKQNKEGN